MGAVGNFIDKVLPGDPMHNITQSTTDKWIKPEHKDAVESLAVTLATMGAIPGVDVGSMLGNLSSASGLPQQVIAGALQDPKNPLMGALRSYLPAAGGDVGKFFSSPIGKSAIQYTSGDVTGAALTAMGAVPGAVGDFFKSDEGKALQNTLKSIVPSNWGGAIQQMGGNAADLFQQFPQLLNQLGNAVGGNFDFLQSPDFGGLDFPDVDLNDIFGEGGDALKKLFPDMKNVKDFVKQYGPTLAMALMSNKETKPYYNMATGAINDQFDVAKKFGGMADKIFGASPNDPRQFTGYDPGSQADIGTALQSSMLPGAGGGQDPRVAGAVQGADPYAALKGAMGSTQGGNGAYDQAADYNQDGLVDIDDLVAFRNSGGTSGAPDANGGRSAARSAGAEGDVTQNGNPNFTTNLDPLSAVTSTYFSNMIQGYDAPTKRLQQSAAYEGVDRATLAAANQMKEAMSSRGQLGANSGAYAELVRNLADQGAGNKSDIQRDLYLDDERFRMQNAQALQGMMGYGSNLMGNQASILSNAGGQAGNMGNNIANSWNQLAQSIAYIQAQSALAKRPADSTTINIGNQPGIPPAPVPTATPTPTGTTSGLSMDYGFDLTMPDLLGDYGTHQTPTPDLPQLDNSDYMTQVLGQAMQQQPQHSQSTSFQLDNPIREPYPEYDPYQMESETGEIRDRNGNVIRRGKYTQ